MIFTSFVVLFVHGNLVTMRAERIRVV